VAAVAANAPRALNMSRRVGRSGLEFTARLSPGLALS
jgi:hypothetical protein